MSYSPITANPFYQPARQWRLRISVKKAHTEAVEEAFGDIALSLCSFEANDEGTEWHTDIYTETTPEMADIPSRLALISGMLGISTPACTIEPVIMKDWISEVERSFPPLMIGRFFVHGSHVKEPVPQSKIGITVNAGAAFGSGEHATTSGCLLALSRLAKLRTFTKPLDMGCGSGILAIAMAKLWHCNVIGTDIDPVSVSTSEKNARINQVRDFTQFAPAEGYNSRLVTLHSPFDIITANILDRPLCKMAPDLNRTLAPGGMAVLSGLLVTQERYVLAAHRAQGLGLIMRFRRSGWSTLVIGKRSG